MEHTMTALERAFYLARSGRFATLSEIVHSLRRDRYDVNQVQGPALRRQLTALIKAARAEAATRDGVRRAGEDTSPA